MSSEDRLLHGRVREKGISSDTELDDRYSRRGDRVHLTSPDLHVQLAGQGEEQTVEHLRSGASRGLRESHPWDVVPWARKVNRRRGRSRTAT